MSATRQRRSEKPEIPAPRLFTKDTLMRKWHPAILSLITASLAVGCASKPAETTAADPQDQKFEQRLRAEPSASSPEEIADRGAYDFITAPGLTHDQKQKVMRIYIRTYNEAVAIREEMGKAKSLLFKTVASQDFKSGDVDRLKSRIVALDQKRLEVMFKALADVQAVVGYGKDKEEIYKHFRDYEIPRHKNVSVNN